MALRNWLPYVLNEVQPYVSSEDIAKGSRWGTSLAKELDASRYGIICLTPDNLTSPWVHFEAGALAKSFSESLVTPFLFGLVSADVVGPLGQFQATSADSQDVTRMIMSLNALCERPIPTERLAEVISTWWPRLEKDLQLISTTSPAPAGSTRNMREMVEELLETTRRAYRLLAERENALARANVLIQNKSRVELAMSKIAVQQFLVGSGYPDARVRLLGEVMAVELRDEPPSPQVLADLQLLVNGAGFRLLLIDEANEDVIPTN